MKKIALEEHFVTQSLLKYTQEEDFPSMNPQVVVEFQQRLLDIHDLRIKAMDEAGVEVAILSLTDPGIQSVALDNKTAVQLAREVNDFLAEQIQRNPTRFRGFAALPMQDPSAAAEELERCVKQYNFAGALINGQTGGFYLDHERYTPFWEKVQELKVPVYLHPGSPQKAPENFEGVEELSGALWGWTVETATHALRLIFSGLLDRYPDITIILGHLGETLPYLMWRLNSRWGILKHPKQLRLQPSEYLKRNFYVTTSGMSANGPLLCAIEEMGEDRVMFSMDYPYESSAEAALFIDNARISETAREKVCYGNAAKLFNLKI